MPFRFGVVTLTDAPQAFVRARIRLEDGNEGRGRGARRCWRRSGSTRIWRCQQRGQFRAAARRAAPRAQGLSRRRPRSAFGHFAAHYREVIDAGARHELNPLVASSARRCSTARCSTRCAALLGVCRSTRRSQSNLVGIAPASCSRSEGSTSTRSSHGSSRRRSIAARHTVGLVDPITAADPEQVNDGLPETLEEVVAALRPHAGSSSRSAATSTADVERLTRDRRGARPRAVAPTSASLDGNEQYDDAAKRASSCSRA